MKQVPAAEQLSFRDATPADVGVCDAIEQACFPCAEAAPRSSIAKRQAQFAHGFILAILHDEVVGFINSAATDDLDISDESFKDMVGHDPSGRELVIFSVTITPRLQGQGLSTVLMNEFLERARVLEKSRVHLLCKPGLVTYYAKFGFEDHGVSDSGHGGTSWHAMSRRVV